MRLMAGRHAFRGDPPKSGLTVPAARMATAWERTRVGCRLGVGSPSVLVPWGPFGLDHLVEPIKIKKPSGWWL